MSARRVTTRLTSTMGPTEDPWAELKALDDLAELSAPLPAPDAVETRLRSLEAQMGAFDRWLRRTDQQLTAALARLEAAVARVLDDGR